jgi:hypothetical protein
MSLSSFVPPYTHPSNLLPALRQSGFALLPAQDVCMLAQVKAADLMALQTSWNQLAPDTYLKDGGRYRKRRHSSYVVQAERAELQAHRAHWQPLEYNALHGGMQRWFEPVEASAQTAAWQALLLWLAQTASALRGPQPWFVEAHQFRIDTEGGIGRPTPEGAHRDGVDLVAVFLVARQGIKGGETRVFDASGPSGQRFTLTEPWSVLLLDDARVIHESTPIQPQAPEQVAAYRDTLVVTLRAHAFQGG